jgi:ketosteroid isomerase-like protein
MSLVPDALTPGDGQDALARYKSAWERRDPDAMLELFAADAEYRPDPFEPALTGANAIRAHWNESAAQQAHVEFDAERVWVAGRTVLSSWHAAYTRRSSSERVRVRGFMTLELDDDGLVSRLRAWALERDVGTDRGFKPDEGPAAAGEVNDG